MITSMLLLFVLILLNGFFAGSELAFISINNNKLKILAEEGNRKAIKILHLKEMPNRFLSTIQIGVSLASILSGAFGADAFAQVLTDFIVAQGLGTPLLVKPIATLLITLMIMFVMLVFGELVPKRVAMSHTEKFAFIAVTPIAFLAKISTPMIHLLSFSTNLVLRLLGIDPHGSEEEVTEEEIRLMVDAGEIDVKEKEMINNIFEFDNLEVADIMTHRTEIVGIGVDADFNELMALVDKERFTRYPVYEDSIDNIVGIIHLRDILRYMKFHKGQEFNAKSLMREPFYVPDSKQTDELFRELQLNKTHMAVVIDEYGGTAGLVTMEDLIEEIMGNIMDEYDIDEVTHELIEVHSGEYLVDASMDLEDLEDVLQIGLPVDDFDTVSGFLISELGRIPTQEDVLEDDSDVDFNGYRFSILEIDEKVISKLRLTKISDLEEIEKEA
ncbi:MAG TPA: hemolysin family protein [Erysipelothrix sp.]|nr:hemolysin family protein [Erysipelothrix sp.]